MENCSAKRLSFEFLGDNLKNAEYAVSGMIASKATEVENALNQGKTLNFTEIVRCNMGNPQLLGQKPLSWVRQGLSLLINPENLSNPEITAHYPIDLLERVRFLLSSFKGGVGSYTENQGLAIVRKSIANYIGNRDSTPSPDPKNIILTSGASHGISTLLTFLIKNSQYGILIPIPQFPLYGAFITIKNGHQVEYYIEESQDSYWKLSIEEIQRAYDKATQDGIIVNSIVVINPGNPTGQVLTVEEIRAIVEFANRNKLVIIADEVYQDNVYAEGKEFCSFRKVIIDLGLETELFSLHSLSKGFYGECGFRSGYMELLNIDPKVRDKIVTVISIELYASTIGQLALDLALNPPVEGMPSYEKFMSEKSAILNSLKRKARIMYEMLNTMDNIKCNHVEGAMYAMPSITFSQRAIQAAKELGIPVDEFYVLHMLENSGVVIVPGSGFGQKPGTYHFRITILSNESKIVEMLERFKQHNNSFHGQYAD